MNDPGDDADDDLVQSVRDNAEGVAGLSADRVNRFYDRVRGSIHRYLESRGSAAEKSSKFLLFVPDVFMLLWRLMNDSRVTGKDKVLLGSALVYFISPFDILPEAFLGPIGYLDDLVFGVFVLNKLLRNTDPQVLRDHWSGDEDVLEMIQRVLASANELIGTKLMEQIRKMTK
jgi:uncharacterized membrane protein YkvA (DUF1232 family)